MSLEERLLKMRNDKLEELQIALYAEYGKKMGRYSDYQDFVCSALCYSLGYLKEADIYQVVENVCTDLYFDKDRR